MMVRPITDPFVLAHLTGGTRSDGGALRSFHNRQLRALVRHAAAMVPFYRRLYGEAGVDVSRFRGLDDLEKLPFVTRADLQQTPAEDLVAAGTNPRWMVTHRSSGSTGIPIVLRRSRDEDLFLQGIRLRALMTVGLRPCERRARVVYVGRDHPQDRHPNPAMAERRGLFPFRSFSGFADPAETAQALARYRPAAVTGHPGFIERICSGADPAILQRIRPRVVASAGECLTGPVRRLIEQAMGARVHDFYAAHEFNLVAWQRESGGPLEVSYPTVLAEVLQGIDGDTGGSHALPGRAGELVGTALWSFAAPVIRYRLGDEVVVNEIDPLTGIASSLREVCGRRTDRFVTRQGTTLHAYEVVEPLLAEPFWFQAYRLEQNAPGRLHARFLPLPGVPGGEPERRLRLYQEDLSSAFELEWEWVDVLPPEENGKRRLFVRNIPLPGEEN